MPSPDEHQRFQRTRWSIHALLASRMPFFRPMGAEAGAWCPQEAHCRHQGLKPSS